MAGAGGRQFANGWALLDLAAVGEQVVTREVRQRPEPLALAPGDQAPQVREVGAPRVRRAARAIAQEEDHGLGIVGDAEGVGDRSTD